MKTTSFNLTPDEYEPILKHLQKEKRIISKEYLSMGEVRPSSSIKKEELLTLFSRGMRMLELWGWQYAGTDRIPPDVTIVKGNVGIHTDYGLGITALVLLKIEPLCAGIQCSLLNSLFDNPNYLWANNKLTEVTEGTVVIFDSSKEHAWFSSGVATFLCIPVKKVRLRPKDDVKSPSLNSKTNHV
jgi:hypothetical protein